MLCAQVLLDFGLVNQQQRPLRRLSRCAILREVCESFVRNRVYEALPLRYDRERTGRAYVETCSRVPVSTCVNTSKYSTRRETRGLERVTESETKMHIAKRLWKQVTRLTDAQMEAMATHSESIWWNCFVNFFGERRS